MRMFARICLTLTIMVSSSASATLSLFTIENIGRPYTPLEGLCVYQEAKGFSFKVDPIDGAIKGAFAQMEARAEEIGADALVSFDIDFANRTQKDEGRVVLCGTLVKYE